MKIKNRLQLNTLAFIALILGIGVMLFVMAKNVNQALERNQHFLNLSQNFFELNIVTSNYLLYQREQALQQWHSKYDSIEQLITDRELQEQGEYFQLASIQKNHKKVKLVFSRLVSSFEKPQQANSSSLLQNRLIGQIQTVLQEMNFKTKELVSQSQSAVAIAQRNAIIAIIGMIFLSVAVISINSAMLKASIIRPIEELRKSAMIVGKGNLEHRIQSTVKDEIGELARTFDNMTEQIQELNQELASYVENLERSNQELQQFAYVASHDLQSPLRAIISYLQLLEKRLKGQLDEKGEKYISRSVESSKRMQILIQDLLSYAKIGSHGERFTEIGCESVYKTAIKNLKMLIQENEAQITCEALPTVMGDPSQLIQLFQNLIGNAIKYRGQEIPRIHINAARQNNEWIFSVQDNGIGIDAEFFERIFVIFQRLHAKNEYSGTGIGLAICKKIVEYHSGRIWVESQPGNGSVFYFTLPIHEGL